MQFVCLCRQNVSYTSSLFETRMNKRNNQVCIAQKLESKIYSVHSKTRIVILTINLSCLLQMSEPI